MQFTECPGFEFGSMHINNLYTFYFTLHYVVVPRVEGGGGLGIDTLHTHTLLFNTYSEILQIQYETVVGGGEK